MRTSVLLVILASPASICIVRRDDVADSAYYVADSAYPAVFAFPNKGSCAATLIDTQHAVRHLVVYRELF